MSSGENKSSFLERIAILETKVRNIDRIVWAILIAILSGLSGIVTVLIQGAHK